MRVSTLSLGFGYLVHKEVLRRNGVIRHAYVRGPAEELDDITRQELDEGCAKLRIG